MNFLKTRLEAQCRSQLITFGLFFVLLLSSSMLPLEMMARMYSSPNQQLRNDSQVLTINKVATAEMAHVKQHPVNTVKSETITVKTFFRKDQEDRDQTLTIDHSFLQSDSPYSRRFLKTNALYHQMPENNGSAVSRVTSESADDVNQMARILVPFVCTAIVCLIIAFGLLVYVLLWRARVLEVKATPSLRSADGLLPHSGLVVVPYPNNGETVHSTRASTTSSGATNSRTRLVNPSIRDSTVDAALNNDIHLQALSFLPTSTSVAHHLPPPTPNFFPSRSDSRPLSLVSTMTASYTELEDLGSVIDGSVIDSSVIDMYLDEACHDIASSDVKSKDSLIPSVNQFDIQWDGAEMNHNIVQQNVTQNAPITHFVSSESKHDTTPSEEETSKKPVSTKHQMHVEHLISALFPARVTPSPLSAATSAAAAAATAAFMRIKPVGKNSPRIHWKKRSSGTSPVAFVADESQSNYRLRELAFVFDASSQASDFGMEIASAMSPGSYPSIALVLPDSILEGKVFESDWIVSINGVDVMGLDQTQVLDQLRNDAERTFHSWTVASLYDETGNVSVRDPKNADRAYADDYSVSDALSET